MRHVENLLVDFSLSYDGTMFVGHIVLLKQMGACESLIVARPAATAVDA
jgi:hypothetical protein